jgi:corrinoid protein of di/trimethylamine methyltransferase
MIKMSKEDILKELRQGLINYDKDATENATKKALEKGISPFEVRKVLIDTIKELGEEFEKLNFFLTELMMAADALKAGLAILESKFLEKDEKPPKRAIFVIGTVKGDVHDIGKNILSTMLMVEGFDVVDLGVDVSNSAFVDAVERYKPDILGLSALMTTTRPMQKELIEHLKERGIREKCKVMVGGAAVTREFAEEIGADGYGTDALETVKVAKKLVAK